MKPKEIFLVVRNKIIKSVIYGRDKSHLGNNIENQRQMTIGTIPTNSLFFMSLQPFHVLSLQAIYFYGGFGYLGPT